MKPALDLLKSMLAHPAPGFICHPAGEGPSARRCMVPVAHIASPAIAARMLDKFNRLSVADADHWRELLDLHDGLHLYKGRMGHQWQELGIASGVIVFPVQQWQARTVENQTRWMEWMGDGVAVTPYGPNDFLAIGHPAGSWNYFHLVTEGRNRGRIYWRCWSSPPEHDDDYFALNVEDFIANLCLEPSRLLNEYLGSFTRYADGVTDIQWVPHEYVADRGR